MQLIQDKKKLNQKEIIKTITRELEFCKTIFSQVSLPIREKNESDDEIEMTTSKKPELKNVKEPKTRAKTLEELQERLKAITSKKKLSFKEKLKKKGLKNRMRKKNRRDERNAEQKLKRAALQVEPELKIEEQPKNENTVLFSKIDFPLENKKKSKHKLKDPKKILDNLKKQKEKLATLEESGEVKKVIEIKEKTAWRNALAKAEGEKIKDDPDLLKKTIKRKEQQKKISKKKWAIREKTVNKTKEEKQKKRTENIEKRKKEKKTKKIKRAVKKGKIIPGY